MNGYILQYECDLAGFEMKRHMYGSDMIEYVIPYVGVVH